MSVLLLDLVNGEHRELRYKFEPATEPGKKANELQLSLAEV